VGAAEQVAALSIFYEVAQVELDAVPTEDPDRPWVARVPK
jgi:hypothetical protein